MPTKSSQVDDSKTREAEMVEKFSAQNLSVLPWWCIKNTCNYDSTFSDLADVPIFFYNEHGNTCIYIYTDRNEYLKLVPYFPVFVHHSGGRTDFQPREDEGSAKTAGGAYLDFEV